jgi:hypothetical protein
MGEAKRRGPYEARVDEAVAKREAREAVWNEKQAERRRVRLEEQAKADAERPRSTRKLARPNLVLATALALAASMNTLPSK